MNYYNTQDTIKKIAKQIPNIGLVETGDIYELLNANQSVSYPAIVITNRPHTIDRSTDTITYNFYIFYVDRLTSDDSNRIDIHNAATEVLYSLTDALSQYGMEIYSQSNITFFNERFNDTTAGAYIEIGVNVEVEQCGELDLKFVTETELGNRLDAYQEELISGVNIKTINGQTLLGEGNIEIKGGEGTLIHYDEGTAYATIVVEDNNISVGDENISINRKLGDNESTISMTDDGIKLTTNGDVKLNGRTIATLNDVQNAVANAPVMAYKSWNIGYVTYGWVRLTGTSGPGVVTPYGVGLTLVAKETQYSGHKEQHLKQYFINDNGYNIMVRDAQYDIYDDGSTMFSNATDWKKLNSTYYAGSGITIDPSTNRISSNSPTEFKTINGQSIIGSGNIVIQGGGEGGDETDPIWNAEKGNYYTIDEADERLALVSDNLSNQINTLGNNITNLGNAVDGLGDTVTALGDRVSDVEDGRALTDLSNLDDSGLDLITATATAAGAAAATDMPLKTINGEDIHGTGNIVIQGGSGDYLPISGGTLKGRLTVGDKDNAAITNAYTHLRKVNDSFVGMAFSVGGDATASIQHKVYGTDFTSARNDAVLRFDATNGLEFGTAASGNVSTYKKVLLEDALDMIVWSGTQAQYDALTDKSLYKLYLIQDVD